MKGGLSQKCRRCSFIWICVKSDRNSCEEGRRKSRGHERGRVLLLPSDCRHRTSLKTYWIFRSSVQAKISRLFQRLTSSSSVEFGVQGACIKRTHLTLCCRPDGTAWHFILVGLWGSFSLLTWTFHSFELSERRKPCCLLKSSHNSSCTSKTLICT